MLRVLPWFFVFCIWGAAAQGSQISEQQRLLEVYQEAEDFLEVKPSRTLALLTQESDLSALSLEQILNWHITSIRVAVALNAVDQMEQSIIAILKYREAPEFDEKLVSVASGIGILLRKLGYYQEAELSFLCGLQYVKELQRKVALLISLAIVNRYLGNNEQSRDINIFARKLSIENNLSSHQARTENNLGILEFGNGNYKKAEEYFRSALTISQSNARRAGHVLNGINLLLTYLVQGKFDYYQRLYPSIDRVTQAFPDDSKKAYLFWVNTAFKKRTGGRVMEHDRQKLEVEFLTVNETKLQEILMEHFSEELGVSVALPPVRDIGLFKRSWFAEIEQCDWDKLKQIPYSDVLQ